MPAWAHRKSRKQFRREAQPLAPNTDTAGLRVFVFRRVLPAQFPPGRVLDGRVLRRETTLPVDGTIFIRGPWFLRRGLRAQFPPARVLAGRSARHAAKPPPWVKYTQPLEAWYRVEDTSLERHELYRGVDASPDLSASPWESFA